MIISEIIQQTQQALEADIVKLRCALRSRIEADMQLNSLNAIDRRHWRNQKDEATKVVWDFFRDSQTYMRCRTFGEEKEFATAHTIDIVRMKIYHTNLNAVREEYGLKPIEPAQGNGFEIG